MSLTWYGSGVHTRCNCFLHLCNQKELRSVPVSPRYSPGQPVAQPTSPPASQPVSPPASQPASQPANQPAMQPASHQPAEPAQLMCRWPLTNPSKEVGSTYPQSCICKGLPCIPKDSWNTTAGKHADPPMKLWNGGVSVCVQRHVFPQLCLEAPRVKRVGNILRSFQKSVTFLL